MKQLKKYLRKQLRSGKIITTTENKLQNFIDKQLEFENYTCKNCEYFSSCKPENDKELCKSYLEVDNIMNDEIKKVEIDVFDDNFKKLFLDTLKEDKKFRNDLMGIMFAEFNKTYKVLYENTLTDYDPRGGFSHRNDKDEVIYRLR